MFLLVLSIQRVNIECLNKSQVEASNLENSKLEYYQPIDFVRPCIHISIGSNRALKLVANRWKWK